MSPNVAMVMPGTRARAMTVSISLFEVTHTGQPGPDARRVPSGMRLRMPLRAMATVWVPHTSMSVAPPAGDSFAMDSMRPRASLGSLKAASSDSIVAASTARARCSGLSFGSTDVSREHRSGRGGHRATSSAAGMSSPASSGNCLMRSMVSCA